MARYQFRLASLLRYRESLRDQCRQVLAQWMSRAAALAAEQDRIDVERSQQMDEMRQGQQAGAALAVDRLMTRRYRIGQLAAMEQGIVRQREEVARQMVVCRQALVRADQGVKALERLSEVQLEEYLHREEQRESREREEIWQAGRGRS